MSRDLRREVALEREQLARLVATFRPLIERSGRDAPGQFDTAALATFLHSFYGGIENILKRLLQTFEGAPGGASSHSDMLEQATRGTSARAALLTEATADSLREYMGFRHVFRHAYSFDLQWEKMEPLVANVELVLRSFEAEIESFLASLPPA